MAILATILAWLLCALAIGGIGTTLYSAFVVRRASRQPVERGAPEPVTLLKPLYGMEPRLTENLRCFLEQQWDAPIQMVAGIQRAEDPAREVVRALGQSHGDGEYRAIAEVVDGTRHGANAKVGNLINMAPAARHDLLVMSDSDMAVPPDYLARIAAALARPGVGAVSCIYVGKGVAGRWSQLAAAASSYHFMPSVLLGLSIGAAKPCMGSTIALRQGTLAAIGGFEAFADCLADDYDIGRAVRALGLSVAVPPMLLVHDFPEDSLAALWRHELRWHSTLGAIDPGNNFGMAFTYPLPFALALIPLMPRFGLFLFILSLLSRLLLKRVVDAWVGGAACPFRMILLRDCLSVALFFRALFVRSVDWRGATLKMGKRGRIAAGSQVGLPGRTE